MPSAQRTVAVTGRRRPFRPSSTTKRLLHEPYQARRVNHWSSSESGTGLLSSQLPSGAAAPPS
ncbi:hypothetical protein [Streptomyces sp. KL116D]|uniref:hypothetical protein n=1 Tax=Streptomyces sp. KL116D TaxID=3045152 RepID=UPI003557FF29